MDQPNNTNNTNGQDLGSELWRHSAPESTQMWDFLQTVNKEKGLQLKSYDDLYDWSIDKVADFWAAVWQFTGIKASVSYEEVGGAFCCNCHISRPKFADITQGTTSKCSYVSTTIFLSWSQVELC